MPPTSTPPQAHTFLAAGTVSAIYARDESHVFKARPREGGEFEHRATTSRSALTPDSAIMRESFHCEETSEGLKMERGTCLRSMLKGTDEPPIPLTTKLRWAQEAAEGLAYIHNKDSIHADVGCQNLIVDNANHIKYIDFAGSSIDGEDPLACYEWCSFQPGHEIGVGTDIFAFGSMLFELETGSVPYHELEAMLEMGVLVSTVERLLSERRFPGVDRLVLGSVISGCWNGEYLSMDGIHDIVTSRHERHMDWKLELDTGLALYTR